MDKTCQFGSTSLRDDLRDEIRGEIRDLRTDFRLKECEQAVSRFERAPSPRTLPLSMVDESTSSRALVGALALIGIALGGTWAIDRIADQRGEGGAVQVTYKPVVETVREPVVENRTRKVNYTVRRPQTETVLEKQTYTVRRPVTETVIEEQPYTVRRPVREITYRKEVVSVPKWTTKTVVENRLSTTYEPRYVRRWCGSYWANALEYVPVTRRVPYRKQVRQLVQVDEVRKKPVESVRYEEEQLVRKVPTKRIRYVEEQRVREVPVERTKYVEEVRTREVPEQVTTYRERQRIRYTPSSEEAPSLPADFPV